MLADVGGAQVHYVAAADAFPLGPPGGSVPVVRGTRAAAAPAPAADAFPLGPPDGFVPVVPGVSGRCFHFAGDPVSCCRCPAVRCRQRHCSALQFGPFAEEGLTVSSNSLPTTSLTRTFGFYVGVTDGRGSALVLSDRPVYRKWGSGTDYLYFWPHSGSWVFGTCPDVHRLKMGWFDRDTVGVMSSGTGKDAFSPVEVLTWQHWDGQAQWKDADITVVDQAAGARGGMRVSVLACSGREIANLQAHKLWRLGDVLLAIPDLNLVYPGSRFRLLFGGLELCGHATLGDIGVETGSELTLVVSQVSGWQHDGEPVADFAAGAAR